ncbi:uncharacterized protein LAJ45_00333 [Morchella importuna]|uniref:uncharacterized protein n=1 Tax=Morchella importuna TaxID=1174673 RepID=UPI001E8E86EB|nr:uncharacterized protein LAJ45_00333 [Morchella importuna]KAH8155323.1 hypothetical protein LAJ45_00333 [Morchella importuna]
MFLREIEKTLVLYNLNQKRFMAAESGTNEYLARNAISMGTISVFENLRQIGKNNLRASTYEKLREQRNHLAHAKGDQWKAVWETISVVYPDLMTEVEKAIDLYRRPPPILNETLGGQVGPKKKRRKGKKRLRPQ